MNKRIQQITRNENEPNHPLYDSNLSPGARCLWALVRQLNIEGVDTSTSLLCELMGIGEDTLRRYRAEVAEAGWLKVVIGRHENSQFASAEFTAVEP